MMITEAPKSSSSKSGRKGKDIALFILALATMIGAMIVSIYYPYPNGKPLGLGSFLALWFPEILLLLFLVLVAISILVLWLLKLSKGAKDAL